MGAGALVILDDIAASLPELRAHAESLMVDRCTIMRRTGSTYDEETMREVPTWVPVYAGRCKVQVQALVAQYETDVHEWTVQRPELHLPVVSSAGVRVGDRAVIDACAADPALIDRTLIVKAIHSKTWSTARRLPCEEVTA